MMLAYSPLSPTVNWLAHLLLSEPTAMDRVGGLLPDVAPPTLLRALPPPFQSGIERHRQIDAFTDRHPIFRRSVARLQPPHRRYGAVYMDIFYDHLLTAHWPRYSIIALREFADEVHAAFDECRDHLPSEVNSIFHRMRAAAWLTSYGELDGVRITLQRMSQRLRRPFDLASGVDQLERCYDDLRDDFLEFFPQAIQRFRPILAAAADNRRTGH